jgi:hypothetical protein
MRDLNHLNQQHCFYYYIPTRCHTGHKRINNGTLLETNDSNYAEFAILRRNNNVFRTEIIFAAKRSI